MHAAFVSATLHHGSSVHKTLDPLDHNSMWCLYGNRYKRKDAAGSIHL